jgi:hypothetical protein
MSFAERLRKKANITNDYEYSCSSCSDESDTTGHTKTRGDLIVMNIDLGARGYRILQGFTNQSA